MFNFLIRNRNYPTFYNEYSSGFYSKTRYEQIVGINNNFEESLDGYWTKIFN